MGIIMMDQPVKTIDIYSLSEYINTMDKLNKDKYYFRGENQLYKSNICSGLLRDFFSPSTIEISQFYHDLLKCYYREVGGSISNDEKEHFLAFCQHHGLKTNLIDFTSSPVVALYFACDIEKRDYDINNKGYLYLIDKENCVDASKELTNNIDSGSFIPYLLNNIISEEYVLEFRDIVERYMYKENNKISNYYEFLNQCGDQVEHSEFTEYLQKLKEIKKIEPNPDTLRECSIKLNDLRNVYIKKLDLNMLNYNIKAVDYTILIALYLESVSCDSYLHSGKSYIFPKIPYFIYKTPYKYDRIKNQEAFFIYQLFYTTGDSDYEEDNLMKQRIEPDLIIRVHNQKKILKELDSIGINRKMIYGDYDNTAKYCNDKFFIK